MSQPEAEPGWAAAQAYREEYEQLTAATRHVALAVAELERALACVGDDASVVSLGEGAANLRLVQAHLASAAERALSRGRIAARRAQYETLQRQLNDATRGEDAG